MSRKAEKATSIIVEGVTLLRVPVAAKPCGFAWYNVDESIEAWPAGPKKFSAIARKRDSDHHRHGFESIEEAIKWAKAIDEPMTQEAVPFRLIKMPCCEHQVCWINPRLPSYCPECGASVYRRLKFEGEHILLSTTGTLVLPKQ